MNFLKSHVGKAIRKNTSRGYFSGTYLLHLHFLTRDWKEKFELVKKSYRIQNKKGVVIQFFKNLFLFFYFSTRLTELLMVNIYEGFGAW